MELTEKVVALRDAATALRAEVSYSDPYDPEEKKRRMTRYLDAGREFYTFVEFRQAFLPKPIYAALKARESVTWKEFVHDRLGEPNQDKYWDNALENSAAIADLTSTTLGHIRDRVQRWETFDPGP